MREWRARRGSVLTATFEARLHETLGIDPAWRWDNAAPLIEEVLCGADMERLDLVYPPNQQGLRLMLTERTAGLPPLRIAFRVDRDDHDKIVYVDVALRAQ